jgi:broad specificity phosphatase PhoE
MPYLYLVRHGQPDFAGNYDSITSLGARQSSWLGEHFFARGLRFSRVVAGTLQRQVTTCSLIQREIGWPGDDVAQDARFNEYDHLSLLQEFEAERLQSAKATSDRRLYFAAIRSAMQQWSQRADALAGGETWHEFGARIQAGIAAACDGLERDANVLVVTSGGVIGRYVAEVLEAGAEAAIQLNLQTRNTSVTEVIRPPAKAARLVSFNAIPHLERAERLGAITHS